ncbi:MAG: N-acetylmuramoyl-L-alanine amidase [Polyangiaceae bacterium]|nr:N-acetylmuramoyl-L-alanine amidase [Polyangiaceae bacterium]
MTDRSSRLASWNDEALSPFVFSTPEAAPVPQRAALTRQELRPLQDEAEDAAVWADREEVDELELDALEGFEGEVDADKLGIPKNNLTPKYTAALQEADVVSPHVHVRWGLYTGGRRPAYTRGKKPADPSQSRVKRVVIHVLEADFKGVVTRWHSQSKSNSTHYVVGKKGAIAQLVAEHHVSWHANSANTDSIGIEHDGYYDKSSNFTNAMLLASAQLVEDICHRHNIAIDRRHIIGHEEVYDSCHGDPGKFFDWDYYLALVRFFRAMRAGKTAMPPVRMIYGGASLPAPWKKRSPAGDKEAARETKNAWNGTYAAKASAGPKATFDVVALQAGWYDVSLWFVPWGTNAKSVTVEAFVGNATAAALTAVVDQTKSATRRTCTSTLPVWRSVGAVLAPPGARIRIEVSASAGQSGNVVVDALRVMTHDRVTPLGLQVDLPKLDCYSEIESLCACKSCKKKKTPEERDACLEAKKLTPERCKEMRDEADALLQKLSLEAESSDDEADWHVAHEHDDELESSDEEFDAGEAEEELEGASAGCTDPKTYSGDIEDAKTCDKWKAAQKAKASSELEEEYQHETESEQEDEELEADPGSELYCAACSGEEELEAQPKRQQRHSPLKYLVERWNLATDVSAAPTFHELIDKYKPAELAKVPTALLVAFSAHEATGFGDATHGTNRNGYSCPDFYEIGAFQVPAGIHGACASNKHESCAICPPGLEPKDKSKWSAWKKHSHALGIDPKNWKDPTTQVRIGLAYVVDQMRIVQRKIRKETSDDTLKKLFPTEGSDWFLRALILLPHVGVGAASRMILKHKTKLLALREDERWPYLSRAATGAETGAIDNVEPKMKGYYDLVWHLTGSAAAGVAKSVAGALGF